MGRPPLDTRTYVYSLPANSRAKRPTTVLFVEDDAPIRKAFAHRFRRAGHHVRCAATVEEGRSALSEIEVDVAFVDVSRCDGSGIGLVRWALSNHRARSVYCMTGSAACREASESLEAGCKSVLQKPIDIDDLAALVDFGDIMDADVDSTEEHSVPAGYGYPSEDFDTWRARCTSNMIIGDDDALRSALYTMYQVADTDCSVLISGESGTGKELFARALHNGSARADSPFIPLNCAALPETMVEAELFGHARGAFTGAHASRAGRVVAAEGGTLFLDEIGDMPLAAQAKLLRMLQDHTIIPVGADTPRHVDLRVVAATNQDLEAMVASGRFRLDLFYRLAVIPVHLPTLRERESDILTLANYFLCDASRRFDRPQTTLDGSARRALLAHHWPGNVRELGQLMTRVVLLGGGGTVAASELGLSWTGRSASRPHLRKSSRGAPQISSRQPVRLSMESLDLRAAIERVERQYIDEALERTGGNRTEAAALLGVNRTTLVEKLRKRNASPV